MNLDDVADELAEVFGATTGLRAFGYPAPSVVPPAVVLGWPEDIDYDVTFARGGWSVKFPVLIAVGKADVRSARDALAAYLATSGASSVRAALAEGRGTAYDSARVLPGGRVEPISIAGIEYLAAVLDVEVMGQGGQ